MERIREITDKYLSKGIRLNSCCSGCDKTVTNLIFEKIIGVLDSTTNTTSGSEALGFGPMDYHEDEATKDENISVIHNIVRDLLLKGGKVKRHLFYYDRISHATTAFINYSSGESFDQYLSDKYKEIKSRLKGVVYESVVNKSNKIQEDELEVEMDNGHFYIKYMQDSIVEPARITNSQEMKKSGLKVCVLQIGESTIKFESKEGKRNYADLTDKSDIVLTFYTSLGELEVRLYPDKQNKDLIRVEVTNQDLLERLKDCKEEVGKNCLFGGVPVIQAIEKGGFTRSGKLMRSEAVSPSKKVLKGVKAAVEGLNPGDISSSSNIFFPIKESIQFQLRARTQSRSG
ncbi:MAG: hypothetical protein ACR5K9_04395 [Wolbachia sp.]